MKRVLALSVVALLSAVAAAQDTQPSESSRAAAALSHSAQSLMLMPSTPSRGGRLVALVEAANRQAPDDPSTIKLSDISEDLDLKAAVENTRKRLAAQPDNYMLGLTYLRLNLKSMSTARARLDFLLKAAQDKTLTPYIQAEALVQAAEVYMGQDQKKEALQALQQASKLDPKHPTVLSGLLKFNEKATPLDQVNTLLQMIQSNPNDAESAWSLALLLDSKGLYGKASVFYDYGWVLTARLNPESINEAMALNYLNGLLDAGQARKALETFVPMRKRLGDSPEYKSLLAEAYRDAENIGKYNQIIDELKVQMGDRESLIGKDPAAMKEIAWYFLINDCLPNTALRYAKEAVRLSVAEDPSLQLILAAAQLRAGDAAAGEAALKKLVDKDIYAAYFLASHYYAKGNAAEGQKALLAGAKLSRRGRAFRALSAIARRQNVTIPEVEGADAIAKAVEAFDEQHLALGQAPENFLAVKLAGLKEQYEPGEPIRLEATLTNTSKIDIRLGGEPPMFPTAMFIPTMRLEVTIGGFEFKDLPPLAWPAPRYLKAGESITATVRLDSGELEEFLMRRPMDELSLRVSGVLDPYLRDADSAVQSMMPTFRIPAAMVRRAGILIEFDRAKGDWEKAYTDTLGYIVKDLKQGDVGDRLVAARRIGSLLTLVADVQAQRADLPKPLASKVRQPVLLTMLKFTMQDASPLVRAEMVRSLIYCSVDNRVWAILRPSYEDKSELVRLRMAELLGAQGQFRDRQLQAKFTSDPDPYVKRMAAAFK